MIGPQLALALAAGMVGAINPCGFSLLPAYVGFFVAGDDPNASLDRRLLRAVGSASAMTVGFVIVFVALGMVLDSFTSRIRTSLPWVTIVIGTLLLLAGVAVASGRRLPVPIPRPRSVGARNPSGMVAYGAVYALASLSCTIGPFLAVTAAALDRSVLSGVAAYVAYAVGMGVIVLTIAASAALARPRPAQGLRRLSRHAGRLGGVLMIVAGGYAIWYGRWELAVYGGDLDTDPVIDAGERFRLNLVVWIEEIGPLRLVAIVIGIVGLLIAASHTFRTRRSPADEPMS